MAMVKCSICGKMVSDKEKKCPYCNGEINFVFKCPKCNSKNIDFKVVPIPKPTSRTVMGDVPFISAFFRKKAAKEVFSDQNKVVYICKDCEYEFSIE